jgi:hypothetical protein
VWYSLSWLRARTSRSFLKPLLERMGTVDLATGSRVGNAMRSPYTCDLDCRHLAGCPFQWEREYRISRVESSRVESSIGLSLLKVSMVWVGLVVISPHCISSRESVRSTKYVQQLTSIVVAVATSRTGIQGTALT